MKIKLYYDKYPQQLKNLKYDNFYINLEEGGKISFNRLLDSNNLKKGDFIIFEYDDTFNKHLDEDDKRVDMELIDTIFLEIQPENSLRVFNFFESLNKNTNEIIKKIEEHLKEAIEDYKEIAKSNPNLANNNVWINKFFILKNLLSREEQLIKYFFKVYMDLFYMDCNADIEKIKLKSIATYVEHLKNRINSKDFIKELMKSISCKEIEEYEDVFKNRKDIEKYKEKYKEWCESFKFKIELLLIIFEEKIFLLLNREKHFNSNELKDYLKELNKNKDYFSFTKKYKIYFEKLPKNKLGFFKVNLFRIKIYLYLKLMSRLKKLLFDGNKDFSKIFKSLNPKTCKVKKSNYKNLAESISFKDFTSILIYLEENNKINEEKKIELFNLYSQYTKIDIKDIAFFKDILSYEMNSSLLEIKIRKTNTLKAMNFRFYNKEIEKVEYLDTNEYIPNSLYALEKHSPSIFESNVFIGKFLEKLSETKYLFEDIITQTGMQIIDIKEEYEILGTLLKIEFSFKSNNNISDIEDFLSQN